MGRRDLILALTLFVLVAYGVTADSQPWGSGGTWVYNPPTIVSGYPTTLAAGYVKSSGTTLSSQAVPIPVADGGTGLTTSPITVPLGGSGATTFTANGVLYGNTAGAFLVTAQGAANSVLTANAGAPSFSATPVIGTSVGIGVTPVSDAKLQSNGHIHSTGTTPSISACGTGSPSISGTDQGGRFTLGTGAPTSCLITFGTAWATTPACVITQQNSSTVGYGVVPATTTFTLQLSTGTSTANFYYVCMGQG